MTGAARSPVVAVERATVGGPPAAGRPDPLPGGGVPPVEGAPAGMAQTPAPVGAPGSGDGDATSPAGRAGAPVSRSNVGVLPTSGRTSAGVPGVTSDVARRTLSNAVTAAVRATIGADFPSAAAAARGCGTWAVAAVWGTALAAGDRGAAVVACRETNGPCTAGGPVLVGPVASSGGWSTADRCRVCTGMVGASGDADSAGTSPNPGAEVLATFGAEVLATFGASPGRSDVGASADPTAGRSDGVDAIGSADTSPTTSVGGGPLGDPAGAASRPSDWPAGWSCTAAWDDPPSGRWLGTIPATGSAARSRVVRSGRRWSDSVPTRRLTAASGSSAVSPTSGGWIASGERAPAPPSSRATGTATDDSADRLTGTAGSPAAGVDPAPGSCPAAGAGAGPPPATGDPPEGGSNAGGVGQGDLADIVVRATVGVTSGTGCGPEKGVPRPRRRTWPTVSRAGRPSGAGSCDAAECTRCTSEGAAVGGAPSDRSASIGRCASAGWLAKLPCTAAGSVADDRYGTAGSMAGLMTPSTRDPTSAARVRDGPRDGVSDATAVRRRDGAGPASFSSVVPCGSASGRAAAASDAAAAPAVGGSSPVASYAGAR